MASFKAGLKPGREQWMAAARATAFMVGIVVTGLLGQASAISVELTSLIWLPTGIAIGLMFRWGLQGWVAVYTGIVLIELIGHDWSPLAFGVGITGTLGTVLAAWILRRVNLDPMLAQPRDAVWLLVAAALGMCVTATGGVFWLWCNGRISLSSTPTVWSVWWRGDMLGVMLAGPLLISCSRKTLQPLQRSWRETLGFAAVVLTVMVVIDFVWKRPGEPIGPVVLIIWGAMRYGILGGTLTAFVCSILDAWAIARSLGQFESEPSALTVVWVDMMTWTLINLMISVIQAASSRDRDALRRYLAQLEQSERRAEHASQVKTQFLANMSHELRTPVAAILGFGEILTRSEPDSPERSEAMQAIRLNGDHLLGLVEDILDITRIETGLTNVTPVPYAPAAIVEEVDLVTRLHAEACGIDLRRRVAADLPASCHIDPTRLRQVLANLVNNAIKFSEPGQPVVLQASVTSDFTTLVYEVVDQGIGISPENQQKLFRPFSQVDPSMSRRHGGTGLGLNLSARLVEAMGGTIAVESREGHGSRFTITLPIVLAPTPVPNPTPSPTPTPTAITRDSAAEEPSRDGSRPPLLGRVLLVEDNPDIRRILQYFLKGSGLRLECAENGQRGVELGRSGDYDLILMDLQMPVLDGYAAMRRLRAEGVQTPMIALTAHASVTDRARCLANGCDDYLTKPITAQVLLDAIQRQLGSGASC